MGLLRLAVLGPPEVFHDSSRRTFALRKALALLLYLAIEGGMHSRSKLAAFLWPDSEPHAARTALRNALTLLRRQLTDADSASVCPHSHLLSEHELLGLDPHTPLELDLDVVQQTYTETQRLSSAPSQEQRAALAAQCQQALALVRGPFLDGFWLGEDAPFDEWVLKHQQQWQVRLHLLLDRLSSWQEAGGELKPARATLLRWLALEPLAEEASRRLMRVHLALGDPTAALQVYATCRARLAEDLRVKPAAETVALAEQIRASAAASHGSTPVRPAAGESGPPSDLVAPLVGRAAAFRHLVERFQQARGGQAQVVLVEGEAGIGKTRLAAEFVAWAKAQGAEVLSGHVLEMGGRLPYQPLVEALRPRLEAENAPEDLLEDLWLAELARLLPELRVRYSDMPVPTEDELTAKGRLFEAVARLVDALARRAPLVLLLEDLQWVDRASLDLLRYLGHAWREHGSRVLLLATVRREGLELNPPLTAELADLGRDLPLSQVSLPPLSKPETLHLVQALVGEGAPGTQREGEWREHGPALPARPGAAPAPSPERERSLVALGEVLFAQTGGQPLYLLETLKLWREREWLVPRLGADGVFRLEPSVDLAALGQEGSRRELVPPSVRTLLLARLAPLSRAARQLVQGVAVLATAASAPLLWQLAELGVQAGVEALEEAVTRGILREEEAGVGRLGRYGFAHELMRDVVYAGLGAARRQVLHQRALALLQSEGARAAELAYHALSAGEVAAAYGYSVQAGVEAAAVFAVEEAIGHYEQARAWFQEHTRLQTELSASEVERLYAHLGRAYAFHNAWEKAQQAYEELLAYAQRHQLPTLVSLTLNRLAVLAAQQSHDKSRVRALLEEAWQMAQTSHDQKALAETAWNQALITAIMWEDPTSALPHGEQALALARASHDQELEARSLSSLGVIHIIGDEFEEAMHCIEASLALYAVLDNEQTTSQELSLPSFTIGAPLTQSLTNRASEAVCWGLLALAQVHAGQVQPSIQSGRRALALSKESKNVWAHINSTVFLTYGLLDAGAYEEALGLTQHAMALARTLPPTLIFQRLLTVLGSVYHALQQWDEARSPLEEADAMAETLDLGRLRVPVLSQLCMNCAVVRLGEYVGPNQRFRIPYLRSLARLSVWEGQREQAIGHLREAAGLAADIGLPGERWQIQAALVRVYEAAGEPEQAHTAFGEAARIIQGLAEDITDETLRARFLAGPQIHPVLQHAQGEASPVPKDQAEQSGR